MKHPFINRKSAESSIQMFQEKFDSVGVAGLFIPRITVL